MSRSFSLSTVALLFVSALACGIAVVLFPWGLLATNSSAASFILTKAETAFRATLPIWVFGLFVVLGIFANHRKLKLIQHSTLLHVSGPEFSKLEGLRTFPNTEFRILGS